MDDPIQYVVYLREVFKAQDEHPEWRKGQTYFNVLYRMEPELADSLRGGPLDPFYRDERIIEFCEEVLKEMDAQEWRDAVIGDES